MVDGPVVAVRGEAFREVPPELARFQVTATARDKDRQATLTRLAERAEGVRALIDSYGAAIERRESGQLQVYPEVKRSGERVVAYHGSVSTTVTVTDFTVLGELMLRLADRDQTQVAGPWWELRPGSPVYREARRAAIGEAVDRAREYADALGARVTALVQLADASSDQPRPMMMVGSTQNFRAKGAMDGVPELDLDPQMQSIQASVEARFTISEPTVLAQPRD
ncbi:SIMPL domain-containing protein [Micromonospora sp. NBC_01699]|uniref:SIMPL domain-containing protein n=1 Tax=Micromonospora sp. NBC_01699 TaxID=2975984 RepID=UPI002E2C8BAD|nr:SIMPL domain-containing protein [Micromonospora sp. NBC_01699]